MLHLRRLWSILRQRNPGPRSLRLSDSTAILQPPFREEHSRGRLYMRAVGIRWLREGIRNQTIQTKRCLSVPISTSGGPRQGALPGTQVPRQVPTFQNIAGGSIRSSSSMTAPDPPSFETILIRKNVTPHVAQVLLNRPQKRNAMNSAFWKEFREAFDYLGEDGDVRVIVVSGEGKSFTAGLDLTDPGVDFTMGAEDGEVDVARRAFRLRKHITMMQEAFNAVERVPQPVLAAVHGACIGAGVDLISACDVRLCSQDTIYSIREVQVGLAADMGTLQRLPRAVGNHSLLRELAYTGRNFDASEAMTLGLVSRVLPTAEGLKKAVMDLANDIAAKSPVAVYGTKANLNYSRDHTIAEGLDYMTVWNMAGLQTKDLMSSIQGHMTKTKPTFSKL